MGSDADWKAISPGDFHCYALKKDGSLWGWGLDFVTTSNILKPTLMSPEKNWTSISAGDYHLAGIKTDGTLWVIGSNASIITRDAKNPQTNWIQLGSETNWMEARSGRNALLARKMDGLWWATGADIQAWATSSTPRQDNFLRVPISEEPLALRSQRGTTLLMMPDGRLWSLGTRIGSKGPEHIGEKLMELVDRIISIFKQTYPRSPNPTHDQKPRLIWETEN